ncbi:hypothetical protein [Streptomyces sp. NPDC004546]|uniref:hypothetical protein n=1 Tax=unclassified Streptomyces TaxID=2593676 RepID=UPI0033B21DD8
MPARTREADVAVVLSKHVGDVVPALRSVKDCSSGYVIATGRDAADASAKCARVIEQIRFHIG